MLYHTQLFCKLMKYGWVYLSMCNKYVYFSVMMLPVMYCFLSHSESKLLRGWTQTLADSLHATAGLGARKGVPLQPLPDPETEGRDRSHSLSVWAPNQNLVSEPTDEMEERPQATQHKDPVQQFLVEQHNKLAKQQPCARELSEPNQWTSAEPIAHPIYHATPVPPLPNHLYHALWKPLFLGGSMDVSSCLPPPSIQLQGCFKKGKREGG